MRSISMVIVLTGTLGLASACSGDGGITPPENTAPVPSFAVPPCTIEVPCDFVSTSTDDAAVTAWSWDFDGDGNADASTANASFTYGTAGAFDVSLTVRDAQDLSQTKTSTITIAPADPVDPVNTPPTAGFTSICTAADCSFTNTSSDVAPGTVATYAWAFGDGAIAGVSDPTHSYTVTGPTDFTVTLTVTDNEGATDVETQTISVAPAPLPNTPPTAGFTHDCNTTKCSFSSASSDVAPGTIATHAWAFGDELTSTASDPSHTYAVVNPTTAFTVTLIVTDNEGASDTETQTITVSAPPPGPEGCTTSGTNVDCVLDILDRSIIKLKLIGISCDLQGQRITIPKPSGDQVFLNVCSRTVGDSTKIFGGPGDSAFVYLVGGQAKIRFTQGTARPGQPTPVAATGQVAGSFPNWTISFEDGAHPGDAGEPDFADVVLQVEAIPPPWPP
jgi:PKD repeat protein